MPRKIGQCWFKKLQQLGKNKAEEIKKELDGKTLVGEYVGGSEFTNIIKYGQESILFHAIVENTTTKADAAYCLPNSYAVLKRLQLDVAPLISTGTF